MRHNYNPGEFRRALPLTKYGFVALIAALVILIAAAAVFRYLL